MKHGADQLVCEPRESLGFKAVVLATACPSGICELMVSRERLPTDGSDNHWVQQFAELQVRLEGRYGKPTRTEANIPAGCEDAAPMLKCIRRGDASIRVVWNWYGQTGIHAQVMLLLGFSGPDSDAMLIFYRNADGIARHFREQRAKDEAL